jgi:hypothetical protein
VAVVCPLSPNPVHQPKQGDLAIASVCPLKATLESQVAKRNHATAQGGCVRDIFLSDIKYHIFIAIEGEYSVTAVTVAAEYSIPAVILSTQ